MSPVTTYSNTHQGNFKCAQVVNLGLMVADPHDLVKGTGDVPTDTERASKAVQDYHAGKDLPARAGFRQQQRRPGAQLPAQRRRYHCRQSAAVSNG